MTVIWLFTHIWQILTLIWLFIFNLLLINSDFILTFSPYLTNYDCHSPFKLTFYSNLTNAARPQIRIHSVAEVQNVPNIEFDMGGSIKLYGALSSYPLELKARADFLCRFKLGPCLHSLVWEQVLSIYKTMQGVNRSQVIDK